MQELIDFVKSIYLEGITPVERRVYEARVLKNLTWGQVVEVTGCGEVHARDALKIAQNKLRAMEWVINEVIKQEVAAKVFSSKDAFCKEIVDFRDVGMPEKAIAVLRKSGFRTILQVLAAVRTGELFANCERNYTTNMHRRVVECLGGKIVNGRPHFLKNEDLPIYRIAHEIRQSPTLRLIPKKTWPNKKAGEIVPSEVSNIHTLDEHQTMAGTDAGWGRRLDTDSTALTWIDTQNTKLLDHVQSYSGGPTFSPTDVQSSEPQTIANTDADTNQTDAVS